MKRFLTSNIGRLRAIAFLEGWSLLLLLFVAMPLKYIWEIPEGSKIIGSVHGALFLLFVVWTALVAMEQKWGFGATTWKILLSCLIPFGTFYVDHKILKEIHNKEKK